MNRYTLEKHKQEDLNKFIVTIVADSNDADYVTTIEKYTKEIFDREVINDLMDIKNNYSGHHQLKNYEGDCDYISVPFDGYDGHCHTLESIDIKYIDANGETWNVALN
jgi:hypothetical protein